MCAHQGYHTHKVLNVRLSAMEHYDRHLPTRAIAQYVACMPHLSIDEEYRSETQLAERLQKAEGEKDELVRTSGTIYWERNRR